MGVYVSIRSSVVNMADMNVVVMNSFLVIRD